MIASKGLSEFKCKINKHLCNKTNTYQELVFVNVSYSRFHISSADRQLIISEHESSGNRVLLTGLMLVTNSHRNPPSG